jgi:hypothetical protein
MIMCNVKGCSKPPAKRDFFGMLLAKSGLSGSKAEYFISAFRGACTEHCGEVASRIGVEVRKDPVMPGQAPKAEPAKHFDSTPDARRQRLAEIQAEMAEPTLAQREAKKNLDDLRAAKRELSELEAYQRAHAPSSVSTRFKLYQYLQSVGSDPRKVNV